MAKLLDLVRHMDELLKHATIGDYPGAHNGLQIENSGEVSRICAAVDACEPVFTEAAAEPGTLLLVHHGMLWGGGQPFTGALRRKLTMAFEWDLALFSSHLPLDAHPEVGNNHVLARLLGLKVTGQVGKVEGAPVGVVAESDETLDEFVGRIRDLLAFAPYVMRAGPERIRRIGIITGGAGSHIWEAHEAGCDTFLTGEGPHHTYFEAEERGINVIYAGHYATETVGVKALGKHLEERFGLEAFFIDHPTGL